jgi:hypothetical protein
MASAPIEMKHKTLADPVQSRKKLQHLPSYQMATFGWKSAHV